MPDPAQLFGTVRGIRIMKIGFISLFWRIGYVNKISILTGRLHRQKMGNSQAVIYSVEYLAEWLII